LEKRRLLRIRGRSSTVISEEKKEREPNRKKKKKIFNVEKRVIIQLKKK